MYGLTVKTEEKCRAQRIVISEKHIGFMNHDMLNVLVTSFNICPQKLISLDKTW